MKIDWEALSQLAKLSPESFSAKRAELIAQTIAGFKEPESGHQLQAQIDEVRWACGGGAKASDKLLGQATDLLEISADMIESVKHRQCL